MTCPLCLVIFEAADAQYVGHLLDEHPEVQLSAAVGFGLVPFLVKGRVAQITACVGITAMAFLFIRRSVR
jgi:hypothetical protein